MKRYLITKTARKDLDEIWLQLAVNRSMDAAERVLWQIHRKIVSLSAEPGSGRRCDIDSLGRCSPVGNYIVYYRQQSGRIAITHIFHGARDQKRAWKPSKR